MPRKVYGDGAKAVVQTVCPVYHLSPVVRAPHEAVEEEDGVFARPGCRITQSMHGESLSRKADAA